MIVFVVLSGGCATGPPEPPVMESYEQAVASTRSADVDERIEAVSYLGANGNLAAVPVIAAALKDDSKLVRVVATLALRNMQTPIAIAPLREALGDADGDVRFSAASALFELGDYSGEDQLIEGLGSPRDDFRLQALMFLGRMRSFKAVGAIIRLLNDIQPRIRSTAAYILGLFGDRSAVEPLIGALADPVPYVRKDAAEALKSITGQDLPFDYDGDEMERQRQIETWKRWWAENRGVGESEEGGDFAPETGDQTE